MAELATIALVSGGLYLLSNMNENEEKLESFTQNHDNNSNKYDVNNYETNNTITDKYFQREKCEKLNEENEIKNEEQRILSMSGLSMNKNDFVHNNMKPFFGGRIKGRSVDSRISESILDNMQGHGSIKVKKESIAQMFKPEKDLNHNYGMPNYSDFYQSRVNPSMKMSNVKPWQEERVGPGLNKGYGKDGSNGFNSGMESREKWLPKTVDQLRTVNNPKNSFSLQNHQGPAMSKVTNLGKMGKMEKHLPDTYYENTPDKWLTTTGLEKAPTIRSKNILQSVNRESTSKDYYGAGGKDGQASYVNGVYEAPKKIELGQEQFLPASANDRNNISKNDYGHNSYLNIPNNRVSTNSSEFGIVGGMMKAVVAPLLDVFKPTKKDNFIGSKRTCGNAKTSVNAMTVYDPNDTPNVTNREMTTGMLSDHLYVGRQGSDAYKVSEQQPSETRRPDTNISYMGNVNQSSGQSHVMSYESAYNQRNNVNKSYKNRPNQGGTQMFNQYSNIQINKKDGDRNNNRMFVKSNAPNATPMSEMRGVNTNSAMRYKSTSDRLNPDLLEAFKKNPYTQSLNSWS